MHWLDEAGQMSKYLGMKGANKLQATANNFADSARALGQQAQKASGLVPALDDIGAQASPAFNTAANATRMFYGQGAQPMAEGLLKAADNEVKSSHNNLISLYEEAKENPDHQYHEITQRYEDPEMAMSQINMIEGYMSGGFMGSIKNIGKNALLPVQEYIEASLRKSPSKENDFAQRALDRLAKASNPKEIEEAGLLAKQKLSDLENKGPMERPEHYSFAAQWARERKNKKV